MEEAEHKSKVTLNSDSKTRFDLNSFCHQIAFSRQNFSLSFESELSPGSFNKTYSSEFNETNLPISDNIEKNQKS